MYFGGVDRFSTFGCHSPLFFRLICLGRGERRIDRDVYDA
jgi:hypothetical protein